MLIFRDLGQDRWILEMKAPPVALKLSQKANLEAQYPKKANNQAVPNLPPLVPGLPLILATLVSLLKHQMLIFRELAQSIPTVNLQRTNPIKGLQSVQRHPLQLIQLMHRSVAAPTLHQLILE
jgi:hypothetical protein